MFSPTTHAYPATRSWGRGANVLARAAELLQRWREAALERRLLLQLDERTLRDLGLSRADAMREAAKPFWRYY
jgi:uncharacterized protein YjiS (DUF1127 family)